MCNAVYNEMETVPSVIVMMGNFQSYTCQAASTDYVALKEQFSSLAACLRQYSRLVVSSHGVSNHSLCTNMHLY